LFSRPNVHRASRYALGGGSILFGLLATAQPERIARTIDVDEETLRHLAMRDLSAGISLLTDERRLRPLLSRLRYDLRGTFILLRKQPALAPLTLLFTLIALVAIFTRD
jgi:hypothetical protein